MLEVAAQRQILQQVAKPALLERYQADRLAYPPYPNRQLLVALLENLGAANVGFDADKALELGVRVEEGERDIARALADLEEFGWQEPIEAMMQQAAWTMQIEELRRNVDGPKQKEEAATEVLSALEMVNHKAGKNVTQSSLDLFKQMKACVNDEVKIRSKIVKYLPPNEIKDKGLQSAAQVIDAVLNEKRLNLEAFFEMEDGIAVKQKVSWAGDFLQAMELINDNRALIAVRGEKRRDMLESFERAKAKAVLDVSGVMFANAKYEKKGPYLVVDPSHPAHEAVMLLRENPSLARHVLDQVMDFPLRPTKQGDLDSLLDFGQNVLLLGHTLDPRLTMSLAQKYHEYVPERARLKLEMHASGSVPAEYQVGRANAIMGYLGLALDYLSDPRMDLVDLPKPKDMVQRGWTDWVDDGVRMIRGEDTRLRRITDRSTAADWRDALRPPSDAEAWPEVTLTAVRDYYIRTILRRVRDENDAQYRQLVVGGIQAVWPSLSVSKELERLLQKLAPEILVEADEAMRRIQNTLDKQSVRTTFRIDFAMSRDLHQLDRNLWENIVREPAQRYLKNMGQRMIASGRAANEQAVIQNLGQAAGLDRDKALLARQLILDAIRLGMAQTVIMYPSEGKTYIVNVVGLLGGGVHVLEADFKELFTQLNQAKETEKTVFPYVDDRRH